MQARRMGSGFSSLRLSLVSPKAQVGFGVDAYAELGLKLDSSDERAGTNLPGRTALVMRAQSHGRKSSLSNTILR